MDIAELEKIMFNGGALGTRVDFEQEYGRQPLGVFIRSIIGMDRQAVNKAFDHFLGQSNLNADQIRFIDTIIEYLAERGIIEPERLFEPPFTDINDQGVLGVFDEVNAQELIRIILEINGRAAESCN